MHLKTEPMAQQASEPPQPTHTRGLLFVLSAPSGTGKDSVIHALKQRGLDFHVVASVTTRAARQGEYEGHPYHFISSEAFEELINHDELIEYANVHGNWYGQPRQQVRENLEAGRDVILKVDVQGAATVRQKLPQAILIFLAPESHEVLARRLSDRQTESEEEYQRRLADSYHEMAQQSWYDYRIINHQGHLEQAVEEVRAIIVAEHCRVQPRFIDL